jgi:hypothetical protein
MVIQNEEAFLDQIFECRNLSKITLYDAKNYLRMRGNERLGILGGFAPIFEVDLDAANRVKEWFHPIMAGATSTDVFAQAKSGDSYVAKPTQDFMGVNLKTLDLVLV